MKGFLDAIPVTSPNESIEKPNITLRRKDDTGEKVFSFTGDLLFTGADCQYIYAKLVTHPNALINSIDFTLEDNCCVPPKTYEFVITHETLEWCGDNPCEITAAATEKGDSVNQMNCLKNTLIWDDYAGFQSKQHPRFSYCNELRPNWLHDVILILGVATATSILVFLPVIASLVLLFNTINVVIGFLNSLLPPGSQINLISFNGQTQINMSTLSSTVNLLASFIVGCGKKHPSPLVRDYAKNVCNKCNLTFSSTILDNPSSPYHNSCYVNAPINKGVQEGDLTTYWLDENKPLLNGTRFFDQLKGIFNGDYTIQNNILYFERRDFFAPTGVWLDLTTYKPVIGGIEVCWKWTNKSRYSYAVFEYTQDGVNWVGGEANARWGDFVEWNNPYSNLQKDEFHPLIEFSACRFRDDGIDRDVLTAYEWAPTIGPVIKTYKRSMLMNSHTCYQPMLLIWDPTSGVANARVDGGAVFFSGYPGVAVNQFYNYPYWFDANYPGNLYDQFWYIDNPKLSSFQGFDFEAELIFDCALLQLIDIDGQIMTSKGLGKITNIELNFSTNKMTIKGTV